MPSIPRDISPRLKALARQFPAVVLTGPRQSGKSTLCRELFPKLPYATLESPDTRAFATEDPRAFLGQYPAGAVLDEIQNCPQLPSYLQELIDRDPEGAKWILTGSQNLAVMKSTNQSLAGRAAILHLLPLNRAEVERFTPHPKTLDDTLLTGGYPRILDRKLTPADWLSSYVASYIERDVRSITNVGDLVTFQRFVQLCAGRTGQLLNLSSLAADTGISQPTAKSWLSVLEASFILFRLPAYASNHSKRLIKMPKLHFYDTGLVCWLLGIRTAQQLNTHPLRGAIFESWVVAEILKSRMNQGLTNGLYFYRDKDGLEADLLVQTANGLALVEVKSAQTIHPGTTAARPFPGLPSGAPTRRTIVYGGQTRQNRTDITLLPWPEVQKVNWC